MAGTVNAKTVRAVLWAAKALGLEPGPLAAGRGLGEAMADVDARFPHAAWIGLWQDIAAAAGGDGIGIDAAERLPWGHWDVIDYLLATSDDLGVALRRFERYFALISTGVAHELERGEDAVRIVRRYAPGCETRLLAPAEFAFATTVAHLRIALGFHFCPREIRFAASPPPSDAKHRRFFGCAVHFGAATSTLAIDPAALTLPMRNPDPALCLILERHAELLVGRLDEERDFAGLVRRAIVRGLPDGDVSVARTARRLGVSVRTLQRRLRDGGLTFDGLYDRTRGDLARRYLDDPGLSIQETAHLLSFGDLRGFYRAFKRWEGRTPAEYRRSARGVAHQAGASSP